MERMTAAILIASLGIFEAPQLFGNNSDWSDYHAARAACEAGKRPFLVLVGAEWCPGCEAAKRLIEPMIAAGDFAGCPACYVEHGQPGVPNTPEHDLADQLLQGISPRLIPQCIVYWKTSQCWERERVEYPITRAKIVKLIGKAKRAMR